MARLRGKSIKESIAVLLVCVGAAILGLAFGRTHPITAKAAPSSQGSDEKRIERKQFPREPFRVGDLSVRKIRVGPSGRFNARSLAEEAGGSVEDWLENLVFTITNSSNKRMTYINVELDFPETTSNGPMMVYNQLGIGVHPEDRLKNGTQLGLDPGDTATFAPSAERIRLLKQFLAGRNFQLADLTQVTIRIDYIIFGDGMRWSQGEYYKPNPAAPGGFERINPAIQ